MFFVCGSWAQAKIGPYTKKLNHAQSITFLQGKLVLFVHKFVKLHRIYMKKLCQMLRTFYKHMVSNLTFKSLGIFLVEALLDFGLITRIVG